MLDCIPHWLFLWYDTFNAKKKLWNCNKFILSTEETCDVFGSKLREQVEDRLKFYESGDIPRKNVDVMHEALTEAQAVLVIEN